MNASSENQSLGTIKCGGLPKLHKNGLKRVPPFEEMPENMNAENLLKHILHLLLPLGGANWIIH